MSQFPWVSKEQRKSRVMGKLKELVLGADSKIRSQDRCSTRPGRGGSFFGVFSVAVFLTVLLTVNICFSGCKKKDEPSEVADRTEEASAGKEGAGAEKSGGGEKGEGEKGGEGSGDGALKGASADGEAVSRKEGKVKTEPADVSAGKGGERKNRKFLYELFLGENKIGTLAAEESFSEDEVTTIADARMKIVRAGLSIKIRAYEVFKEKLSGTPVSFRVLMDQGVSKMEAKGVYKDGKMVVTDSTGTNTLPYKNEWLFPYSVGELVKSKGFNAGTKYSYLKFQPQFGNKGVLFTHEIVGREAVVYKGKKVKCHKIKVSSPVLPSQTVCVDDNYIAYEMDMQMGGMSLKTKLVSISEH